MSLRFIPNKEKLKANQKTFKRVFGKLILFE